MAAPTTGVRLRIDHRAERSIPPRQPPQLVADGSTTATLRLSLPGNARVDRLDVVLTAQRAAAVAARAVAQLRVSEATAAVLAGQGKAVVVDFGTPRTVSELELPEGLTVWRVLSWTGAAFAPTPAYQAQTIASDASTGAIQVTPRAPSSANHVFLDAEVRTERLQIELLGEPDEAALPDQLELKLPEAPADLELAIDAAAPAWRHPGPVIAGTGTGLDEDGWNADGRRLVALAPFLPPPDPTAPEPRELLLTLKSRVPGVLALAEHARTFARVWRTSFGGRAELAQEFAGEGLVEVALELPPETGDPVRIEALQLTVSGEFGTTRTLPPLGPEPTPLAELALDPQHAAIVRLGVAAPLAKLAGLRLPLRIGADGAEARVALWSGQGGEPAAPLPEGASAPVQLAGGLDTWVDFTFARPLALEGEPLWAALLPSRGELAWSLAQSADADDPAAGNALRRGPPAGPWRPLPAFFASADASANLAAGLRGRVRALGTAPAEVPLAPLTLGLADAAAELTPEAKEARIALRPIAPLMVSGTPVLQLIARSPGRVTLREVDVVVSAE